MPIYTCCNHPHCYQKTLTPGIDGEIWYCDEHKSEDGPKLSVQQEANIDQAAHAAFTEIVSAYSHDLYNEAHCVEIIAKVMTGAIAEVAAENNLLHIDKGQCIDDIEKLKEALDAAEYAFNFIVSKGCLCPIKLNDDALAPVHGGLCHVLAAQNGLAAIKEKMGDD